MEADIKETAYGIELGQSSFSNYNWKITWERSRILNAIVSHNLETAI